jgi:hypothetical protein
VGKSVWVILIFGFLTAIILTLGMLMGLSTFEESPLSRQTKLALTLKEHFSLLSVGTEQLEEAEGRILRIVYEAPPLKKPTVVEAARTEMETVARYAMTRLPAVERKRIHRVRLKRVETLGRGCFQNTYVQSHEYSPSADSQADPGQAPR